MEKEKVDILLAYIYEMRYKQSVSLCLLNMTISPKLNSIWKIKKHTVIVRNKGHFSATYYVSVFSLRLNEPTHTVSVKAMEEDSGEVKETVRGWERYWLPCIPDSDDEEGDNDDDWTNWGIWVVWEWCMGVYSTARKSLSMLISSVVVKVYDSRSMSPLCVIYYWLQTTLLVLYVCQWV